MLGMQSNHKKVDLKTSVLSFKFYVSLSISLAICS